MMQVLDDYSFSNMVNQAKSTGDVERLIKLIQLKNLDEQIQKRAEPQNAYNPPPTVPRQATYPDVDYRGNKIVRLDVEMMIQNFLKFHPEKHDIQVAIEEYGSVGFSVIHANPNAFVVVNICNLQNNTVLTLREKISDFPSIEFLTKLTILNKELE